MSSVSIPDPYTGSSPSSRICSTGLSPVIIDEYLIAFLQQNFAEIENIRDPILRRIAETTDRHIYQFRRGDDTGLAILSRGSYNPRTVETMPALVVRRNAWTVERMGINNQMMGNVNIEPYQRFEVRIIGSSTVFAIAKQYDETENLGFETAIATIECSSLLARHANMLRISVIKVDAPLLLSQEGSENWCVAISVAYGFTHTFTLRSENPPIRQIVGNQEIG